jgi:hypothetical protein
MLGFEVESDINDNLKKTYSWYKENKWIK